MKTCTICKQDLPANTEYFYPQKKGKGGLMSHCKKCHAAYTRKWYVEHRK